MKKKILSLLIAAMMVAGTLASCGSSDDDATKTPETTAQENKTTGGTLLLGGIGPLTGGAAVYGTSVKNGMKLAIDEINAAGGVNGMMLDMKFEDDEHDPEKAVNAYNTLKDSIKLLVGTVTSKPCIAISADTHNDNMFMLTPSGSAVDCVKYDNAFRICFNDPNQGSASAKYIATNKIASKVAVIYDSSDVYSQGIFETFQSEATAQGLEVVEAQAFTGDAKTDFSVQLQKIQSSGAELLFLPIYYQEAALILQQAKQINLSIKYFGCDGLDGLIGQLGEDVALCDGVMLLTPFVANATDDKSVKFTKAYEKAFNNETPTQFAADAYDAVYTVKAALEKADVKDASISTSDLCDLLKAAMTQITVDGVTGTITWSADGEPAKDPKAMSISVKKDADDKLVGEYVAINNTAE